MQNTKTVSRGDGKAISLPLAIADARAVPEPKTPPNAVTVAVAEPGALGKLS